jgi:hypothetical protein
VRQAIEQRGGELLVTAKDLDPLGEGKVGGDDDASSLVALGEQIEEELAASAVEGDEAKLVEHEKAYVDSGASYYEERYRERTLNNLCRRAGAMGFALVPSVVE